jgi:hypothetical protein
LSGTLENETLTGSRFIPTNIEWFGPVGIGGEGLIEATSNPSGADAGWASAQNVEQEIAVNVVRVFMTH